MHACLQQQDDDENQVLQEDEEGAKDRTHDLAKVVLDLQEKVALMSKELKEYKKETDQKQKKTEEEQQKKTEEQQKKTEEQQRKTKEYVEEQVALISRNIEMSEEDVEDPIAPISDNPKTRGIDQDTFSIMMTSKVSQPWMGLRTRHLCISNDSHRHYYDRIFSTIERFHSFRCSDPRDERSANWTILCHHPESPFSTGYIDCNRLFDRISLIVAS